MSDEIGELPVYDYCLACGAQKPETEYVWCTSCAAKHWTRESNQRRVLRECTKCHTRIMGNFQSALESCCKGHRCEVVYL